MITELDKFMTRVIDAIFEVSANDLGQSETHGKNRSPFLDKMITGVGGKIGDPYCVWWVQHINSEICKNLFVESCLPMTGSSQELFAIAQEKFPDFIVTKPAPGRIAVFRSKKNNTKGHVAICKTFLLKGYEFRTREANTNGAGDRDGQGIMDKLRHLGMNGDLDVIGFIDWPSMFYEKEKGLMT